ncbi:hypothetical protein CXB51_032706 [Gossypium anomalum]|uniref:Purple acid phosphatase C-terminal domain-containing protein n=1 Tax=Gossypium anomalum TaxID=47600 RepID=A0A8J6CI22_9ROSI|nr:hypothetical protein CXB51_032706 [Gossypium anomalum]
MWFTVQIPCDQEAATEVHWGAFSSRPMTWFRLLKLLTPFEIKSPSLFLGKLKVLDHQWIQYHISNIRYNVSSGECYPILDKSALIYITVGDGGNQEGLAGRFLDPQPEYSAFQGASYGHSTLEVKQSEMKKTESII